MKESLAKLLRAFVRFHRWESMECGRKAITKCTEGGGLCVTIFWGRGRHYDQIEHQGWYHHRDCWRRDAAHSPTGCTQIRIDRPDPDRYPRLTMELSAPTLGRWLQRTNWMVNCG